MLQSSFSLGYALERCDRNGSYPCTCYYGYIIEQVIFWGGRGGGVQYHDGNVKNEKGEKKMEINMK